jgi:hypothetical protein
MATYLKPPPPFVKSIGAWEYVLAKLANKQADDGKQRLDEGGNPLNYAAAVAIYKNVVKKYAHFGIPNIDMEPVNLADAKKIPGHHTPMDLLNELADSYPVGQMFWFDDVMCRAVERNGGMAVFPDPEGYLLIQAEVLDVDPEGKYRSWPVGKIFEAQPHRCFSLAEA